MKLSNRITSMQFSPIRKLAPYATKAREDGKRVLGLNIGQPDIETPSAFFDTLKNYEEKVLAYSDSRGQRVLLDAFTEYYAKLGYDFKDENMVVTNGGSEALLFSLMAICDPEDEVLVPEPFYTNYSSFTEMAGCKVTSFMTYKEDGFHLPAKSEIVAKITPNTKAILYSSPSNPTGTVYTKAEIELLRDLAIEYNLFLITDEVYRELVYDDLTVYSPLAYKEIEDRVVLTDSISKRFSACGARIGLVASKNTALINEIMKLTQARLCAPTVEQVAAAALYRTPESFFEKTRAEYQHRRDILFEGLSSIPGVFMRKPEGAFYIIAKFPVKSSEHFCQWILESYDLNGVTVMMAPAGGFYNSAGLGEDEVRISYCIKADDLKIAVEVLRNALVEYSKLF